MKSCILLHLLMPETTASASDWDLSVEPRNHNAWKIVISPAGKTSEITIFIKTPASLEQEALLLKEISEHLSKQLKEKAAHTVLMSFVGVVPDTLKLRVFLILQQYYKTIAVESELTKYVQVYTEFPSREGVVIDNEIIAFHKHNQE